jgi:hypothetical protein
METKAKNKLYQKYERLRGLLWKRADKIEAEAEALRQEIAQLGYIIDDFYKLADDSK